MTSAETTGAMPPQLAEIAEEFNALEPPDRLQLLLEFSDELPELPERYADAPDKLEQVHECQSPLFLHVDAADPQRVRLYFSAPAEAPTTRGFAAILAAGLDGQSAEAILAVPDDFYAELGLSKLISPLRLRGMSAMLTRIKRRVRQQPNPSPRLPH